MSDMCTDNRFEIIEKAKKHILEATNINTSPEEMKVLDNFLYRCWQMGWLNKYKSNEDGTYVELFAMKDGIRYDAKIINMRDVSTTLVHGLMDGIENLWTK